MKFMVGVSSHIDEPYFFLFFFFIFFFLETVGPIESVIWGKCAPKNGFLVFIQPVCGFLRKKFQSCIRYLISHRKGLINFYCPTTHSLKSGRAPKNYFSLLFWKIMFFFVFFFLKKLLHKKYLKPNFLQKSLY